MKKNILAGIFAILSISLVMAQDACHPKKEGKLRIFGDSWAQFPFIYHSYDTALVQFGFPDFISKGDGTAIISMNSEAFLNPLARFAWEPAIDDDSIHGIDAMVFTLGGNDVAFKVHVGDSVNVLDAPFAQSRLNMDTLIDYIMQKLPNLQILWTCYDYPNFLDPLLDYPWDPYFDLWDSRGRPEPYQINAAVQHIAFLQDSLLQVWGRPYIHFVNNLGLMQYTYGQYTPLRGWPYGTYPARSVPFPGGDPNYPTPYQAMGLGGLDTYHLNGAGFTVLAAYQMRAFFMDYFRRQRDTMIYSMGQTYDGWVSETGTTGTGQITVGQNAALTKIKGIVSFNTDFIPDDKRIKKASLFIRRKDGSYKSFIHTDFPLNFKLDIKSGTFGSDQVDATDYTAAASAEDIACFAGRPQRPDYTLRMDLLPAALQYINKTGVTQFRVEMRVDTAQGASLINFFNGDTTAYEGPFLDIYYDTTSVISGIKNQLTSEIKIYPNPVKDRLYISPDKKMKAGWYSYEIYDEKGALITVSSIQLLNTDNVIDVSNLQSGTYIIKLNDKENSYGASFVKTR